MNLDSQSVLEKTIILCKKTSAHFPCMHHQIMSFVIHWTLFYALLVDFFLTKQLIIFSVWSRTAWNANEKWPLYLLFCSYKLEQSQRERLRWQILDENILWVHMYCNFTNIQPGKNVLRIIKMNLMPVRESDDGYNGWIVSLVSGKSLQDPTRVF